MSVTRRLAMAGAAASLAAGPSLAAATGGEIILGWDALATSRLKYNPQLGPVGDALMGAGLATAVYTAWADSDRTQRGAEEAISYAACRFLQDRFSDVASQVVISNRMTSLGYDPGSTVRDRSAAGVGNSAGAAAIAARSSDGSNYKGNLHEGAYSDQTSYTPVNSPMEFSNPSRKPNPGFAPAANVTQWQPLKNPVGVVQKFAGPQMGWVTPFSLSEADVSYFEKKLAKPDYLKDPALFLSECERSLDYSAALNSGSKLQVDFWADGPGSKFYPTAHWRYFLADLVRRRGYDLERTAKAFYVVATATADAGIMTWRAKRLVNGSRPITGIRNLFNGRLVRAWGGPGRPTEMVYGESFGPFNPSDPDMTVAHQSPGFPGWPSGHTMFSGACARVLQLATGGDEFGFTTVIPAGFGTAEPNVPPVPTLLGFATFSDAANSATMSRIHSGIHFAPDCSPDVMKVAAELGDVAWSKAQKLFG